MERQVALDLFDVVSAEAKQYLFAAAALHPVPFLQEKALEHLRDCLGWACNRLSLCDDDDVYERCFLPFFDALSHVTDCIKRKLNVREVVTICLAMILNNKIAPA